MFRDNIAGLGSVELGKIGAVEPLEYVIDGEPGRGVGSGLADLSDDKVDMRLSQVGGVFSEPLNSKVKGPCPNDCSDPWTEGCPAPRFSKPLLSFDSGVEPSVLVPPLTLLDDVRGRAAELRFRSLEVGAEAGWGSGDGVVGMSCGGRMSCSDARDGILLFFDVGLAAIECRG